VQEIQGEEAGSFLAHLRAVKRLQKAILICSLSSRPLIYTPPRDTSDCSIISKIPPQAPLRHQRKPIRLTFTKSYRRVIIFRREGSNESGIDGCVPACSGRLIGFVEELPCANTQGATLEEARRDLTEAVQMVLEANRELAREELKGQEVIREPLEITAA